jgi:hypothetical protein
MSIEDQRSLRRINPSDLQAQLINLDGLPPEKKLEIQTKLAENAIELNTDLSKRFIKSAAAEHDMAVTMDQIKTLDHTKKIYSVNQNFETGSGDVKINVKGGDVNFLVPVLIVIGLIVMGLVYIMHGK